MGGYCVFTSFKVRNRLGSHLPFIEYYSLYDHSEKIFMSSKKLNSMSILSSVSVISKAHLISPTPFPPSFKSMSIMLFNMTKGLIYFLGGVEESVFIMIFHSLWHYMDLNILLWSMNHMFKSTLFSLHLLVIYLMLNI